MKKKKYSTVDGVGKWFDSKLKKQRKEEKKEQEDAPRFEILRGHLVEVFPVDDSAKIVKKERKPRKYRENSKRKAPLQHGAYINSELWEERKAKYYKKHKKECARCGGYEHINLHHMFYDNKIFGSEPDKHLIPLCWLCHEKFHSNYPTKKNMIFNTKEFISTYKQFGELLSVKKKEVVL